MDHTRHSNIYTVPPYFSVGIAGAGGLGAMTALVLAKMGVRLMTIWDDDIVSATNIPTQLHPVSDVGMPKVYSLAETLEHFSDEIVPNAFNCRIELGHAFQDPFNLFIAAVDSITARKDIWSAVANSQVDFYLDIRMAAEELQLFLVKMHDLGAVERYHELLFRLQEGDVPELTCTAKSTFYTAAIASGHAGKILRDIVRREANSHRLVHYIPQNHLRVFDL